MGRADLCECCKAPRAGVRVASAQDAELEFGRGDDRHGGLVGEVAELAAGLLDDEDRRVGEPCIISAAIWPWAVAWSTAVLALAALAFRRRDL